MTKQEILEAHRRFLFPAVFHYYREPLVLVRARDQFVWDADGNQYLDFFGGIVTISVGHVNPEVTRRVHEQLDRLQHVSTLFATEPMAALAARIAGLTPGGRLTKSFFSNSGSEANEMALLTARCYTGVQEVIALRHSYHGRTGLAMALTGQAAWRAGAVAAGVVHAHNAYCYRCAFGLQYPACELRCARDLEELIRTATGGRVAAFIAEPIQGVGGFITPPPEYFALAAEIVRRAGGLFIADEVQTAWGRTGGRWFGIEHWGVTPDIIVSAKGLANGLPIGLTVARPEVADALPPPTISTFGGNPAAAAAALAVIDYIAANRLLENAAAVGAWLRARLEELRERHPLIGDVRGMGLMQALELVRDRGSKEPAAAETAELLEAARENRLLIGRGGLYGNVVRITPPLNVSREDVEEFARRLEAALEQVEAGCRTASGGGPGRAGGVT